MVYIILSTDGKGHNVRNVVPAVFALSDFVLFALALVGAAQQITDLYIYMCVCVCV